MFGQLQMLTTRGNGAQRWKPFYCRVCDGYLAYFAPRGGSSSRGDEGQARVAKVRRLSFRRFPTLKFAPNPSPNHPLNTHAAAR